MIRAIMLTNKLMIRGNMDIINNDIKPSLELVSEILDRLKLIHLHDEAKQRKSRVKDYQNFVDTTTSLIHVLTLDKTEENLNNLVEYIRKYLSDVTKYKIDNRHIANLEKVYDPDEYFAKNDLIDGFFYVFEKVAFKDTRIEVHGIPTAKIAQSVDPERDNIGEILSAFDSLVGIVDSNAMTENRKPSVDINSLDDLAEVYILPKEVCEIVMNLPSMDVRKIHVVMSYLLGAPMSDIMYIQTSVPGWYSAYYAMGCMFGLTGDILRENYLLVRAGFNYVLRSYYNYDSLEDMTKLLIAIRNAFTDEEYEKYVEKRELNLTNVERNEVSWILHTI